MTISLGYRNKLKATGLDRVSECRADTLRRVETTSSKRRLFTYTSAARPTFYPVGMRTDVHASLIPVEPTSLA